MRLKSERREAQRCSLLLLQDGRRLLLIPSASSGQEAAANRPVRLRLWWDFFVCFLDRFVAQRLKDGGVSAGRLIEGMFYSLPSIIHPAEPVRRVYTGLNSQRVADI